ncbi:MAG TPA: hypothetical protein VER09_04315 [Pseudomonas sp.]|nr:hypothetical protein [Pseudomonas sp.]
MRRFAIGILIPLVLALTACAVTADPDYGRGYYPPPGYGQWRWDDGVEAYVSLGYPYLYYHDHAYYRWYDDHWSSAPRFNGPWRIVEHRYVPSRLGQRYYPGYPGRRMDMDAPRYREPERYYYRRDERRWERLDDHDRRDAQELRNFERRQQQIRDRDENRWQPRDIRQEHQWPSQQRLDGGQLRQWPSQRVDEGQIRQWPSQRVDEGQIRRWQSPPGDERQIRQWPSQRVDEGQNRRWQPQHIDEGQLRREQPQRFDEGRQRPAVPPRFDRREDGHWQPHDDRGGERRFERGGNERDMAPRPQGQERDQRTRRALIQSAPSDRQDGGQRFQPAPQQDFRGRQW